MRSLRQSNLHSRGFVERRRRRLVLGTIAGLVAIVAWVFVMSRLSYAGVLTITNVDVYGEPDVAPAMQAAALRSLNGTYAGLFARSNTLIYPKVEIAREVASTSPRIARVAVTRNGLHGLTISVSEKAPDAVICADLPDLTDEQVPLGPNCYLSDAASYLYRRATDPDAANYPRFYFPDLPDTGILGTTATSTVFFKRLQGLVHDIQAAGITVHAMLVKGNGEYELYADNPAGTSLVVISMNERAGLDTEKANLIEFWHASVAHAGGRSGAKPPEWNEIKLQFPPNVYSR